MRIAKYVQKPTMVTPLYQQLLVLIPLLKVIEESRPLINNGGKPFRHEANHLPSGQLCIGLTEANSDDDSGDRPEKRLLFTAPQGTARRCATRTPWFSHGPNCAISRR